METVMSKAYEQGRELWGQVRIYMGKPSAHPMKPSIVHTHFPQLVLMFTYASSSNP